MVVFVQMRRGSKSKLQAPLTSLCGCGRSCVCHTRTREGITRASWFFISLSCGLPATAIKAATSRGQACQLQKCGGCLVSACWAVHTAAKVGKGWVFVMMTGGGWWGVKKGCIALCKPGATLPEGVGGLRTSAETEQDAVLQEAPPRMFAQVLFVICCSLLVICSDGLNKLLATCTRTY
jgi:hypothetical protein